MAAAAMAASKDESLVADEDGSAADVDDSSDQNQPLVGSRGCSIRFG